MIMVVFLIILLAQIPLKMVTAFTWTSKDVCGFEQKCSTSVQGIGEYNDSSCCQTCECSDVCFERDTCCFDKYWGNVDRNVTKQECIPALFTATKGRNRIRALNSYFVRSRCPDAYQDRETKEKCEGGKEPETLDDVLFVSSADGRVVYKNRFCSLCHGEKNLVPWKIMIDRGCIKAVYHTNDILSHAVAEQTMLTRCTMIFKRPEVTPAGAVLCFNDREVISECNKTGKWKTYDAELENLCRDPPEAVQYFDQGLLTTKVYSNAYCFLCNVHSFPEPNTCRLDLLEKGTSLLTLLDTSKWPMDRHKESKETVENAVTMSEKCKAGMIYDSFLGICKKIYCQIPTIPYGNGCKEFIAGSDLGYRVDLQLVLQDEINTLDIDDIDFTSLFPYAARLLKFDACELCLSKIYLPHNSTIVGVSKMLFRLAVRTTTNCTRDYILSTVASFEGTNFSTNIDIGKKSAHFVGSVRNYLFTTTWKIISSTGGPSCRLLLSDRISVCPKVKLTANEYKHVLQNHTRADDLLFSTDSEEKTGGMFVCLENYIEEPQVKGTANQVSATTVAIAVFAIISSQIVHLN